MGDRRNRVQFAADSGVFCLLQNVPIGSGARVHPHTEWRCPPPPPPRGVGKPPVLVPVLSHMLSWHVAMSVYCELMILLYCYKDELLLVIFVLIFNMSGQLCF